MVKIISRFFAFCGEENRRRFHQSILLGFCLACCRQSSKLLRSQP